MHHKQHTKTLSSRQKIEFITVVMDCSEGRCIGIAKTQHRRCRNLVKHHQWSEAMKEIIELAEDLTIHPDDLELDATDLAKCLSCHLHHAQPGSPIAILNAIHTYRKTFEIAEPTPTVQHQPYAAPEDPVSENTYGGRDASFETPFAAEGSVKSEQSPGALKAALLKISTLEARLATESNQSSSSGKKAAVPEPSSTTIESALLQRLEGSLGAFEARLGQQFTQLSRVQEKLQKDMDTLAATVHSLQSAAPVKEKIIPRDNLTEVLEKLALLLKQ